MVSFNTKRNKHFAKLSEQADSVAVIGLGRFGSALAEELMFLGTEVLAVDSRADIVQAFNGRFTHVVCADTTKEEVLHQLSIPDFDRVVVAIGSDLEASILTTSLLLRLGIENVWAKAVSAAHGAILEQIGVPHVIYPEKEMGRRVAHLVRSSMQDFIEVGNNFAFVRTTPPARALGQKIAELNIWSEHGVKVIAYKRTDQEWAITTPESVLLEGDTILIAGPTRVVEYCANIK